MSLLCYDYVFIFILCGYVLVQVIKYKIDSPCKDILLYALSTSSNCDLFTACIILESTSNQSKCTIVCFDDIIILYCLQVKGTF